MELSVLSINGAETGRKINLPSAVFEISPNDHAIYLDVKQFLANQRQGTHKSKQRNEVAGSTKKIKKQKGTGGARAGSLKAPNFRGGGRVFGPVPRDYSFKLNKKLKRLARFSALSYKASSNSISVLENFTFEAPRTKDFIAILEGLSAGTRKTLMVVPQVDKNVYLSSRNLEKARVTTFDQLNTYDIVNADHIIVLEGTVEKFAQLA